jgi:nucleotide-binding universal stress UspA family protein
MTIVSRISVCPPHAIRIASPMSRHMSSLRANAMPGWSRASAHTLRRHESRAHALRGSQRTQATPTGALREGLPVMLPRTILVATDFSEHADAALAYAAELGAHLDATLHLVHAIKIPTMGVPEVGVAYAAMTMESSTQAAQREIETLVARYRDRVSLAPPRLEVGDPRDVIDNIAEVIGADLIVMGTHGRRGLRRVLLGSVAEAIVRTAPCPVLTIRPKKS